MTSHSMTSNSMANHSMTNTSNMASSVDGGLCMSMGTDLTRNLLLNWMADFSGNSPGNWNLDGVTGNILDRPCGGDTSGLNAGYADLFWYMTDNSVADLARNRDTDLMGDWDTDLAGHRNA